MEVNNKQHWTEENEDKFRLAIALDFVDQIEAKMDAAGIKQSELAQKLGVTEGRVSQILNNPGNLTLGMMVKCARAVDMKMTVVAYEDGDSRKTHGPIHAEVFRSCWQMAGKPRDMWSLSSANSTIMTTAMAGIGEAVYAAGGGGWLLYSCSSPSGVTAYYNYDMVKAFSVPANNTNLLLPQKQPRSNDATMAQAY
jgi:antitoxin component HigA of HigAB toxin-antitoxin module